MVLLLLRGWIEEECVRQHQGAIHPFAGGGVEPILTFAAASTVNLIGFGIQIFECSALPRRVPLASLPTTTNDDERTIMGSRSEQPEPQR